MTTPEIPKPSLTTEYRVGLRRATWATDRYSETVTDAATAHRLARDYAELPETISGPVVAVVLERRLVATWQTVEVVRDALLVEEQAHPRRRNGSEGD